MNSRHSTIPIHRCLKWLLFCACYIIYSENNWAPFAIAIYICGVEGGNTLHEWRCTSLNSGSLICASVRVVYRSEKHRRGRNLGVFYSNATRLCAAPSRAEYETRQRNEIIAIATDKFASSASVRGKETPMGVLEHSRGKHLWQNASFYDFRSE